MGNKKIKTPTKIKIKKKHRFRPGTVSLREIRRYQKTDELLLPKLSFTRVVREIVKDQNPYSELRMTSASLEALQVAAEEYLTSLFHDSQIVTIHGGRIQLEPEDLYLTLYQRGTIDEGNYEKHISLIKQKRRFRKLSNQKEDSEEEED